MVDSAHWLFRISPVLRPNVGGYSHTGEDAAPVDYQMPPRIIYDHELILYRGSRFHLQTEEREIVLPPDSFVIIPPGIMHSELNGGEKEGHRYWCHFDWTNQAGYETTPAMTMRPGAPRFELCRYAPDYVPAGVLSGPAPERVFGSAREISRMMRAGGEENRLKCRAVLLAMLIDLLGKAGLTGESPSVNHSRKAESLASSIRKILDKNTDTPSLRKSLDRLGYSYEHLCRIFKGVYGISPIQYVRANRMNRARFLLKNTNLQIAEIAYRVGFASPAYFTGEFKRYTGTTPGRFRKGEAL